MLFYYICIDLFLWTQIVYQSNVVYNRHNNKFNRILVEYFMVIIFFFSDRINIVFKSFKNITICSPATINITLVLNIISCNTNTARCVMPRDDGDKATMTVCGGGHRREWHGPRWRSPAAKRGTGGGGGGGARLRRGATHGQRIACKGRRQRREKASGADAARLCGSGQ